MSGATAPASVPLRGQNNVQGGGDMGAIPNKFPGGQDVENPELRAKFERAYGRQHSARKGLAPEPDVRGDGSTASCGRSMSSARTRSSPKPTASARRKLLDGLDHFVVQDMFLTKTAERGARGAAGRRVVVRVRGHGDEQRAAGAARPQSARSAGPGARRHRDPVRRWRGGSARTGATRPRNRSGTKCGRCRRGTAA